MQKETILDKIYDYLGKFIYYPSENARIAHTAWIAHTHLTQAFYYSPRLYIVSPQKRSGKSRLLEITALLAQNPETMLIPTSSTIYRSIEGSDSIPTFLMDEIGRTFEKKVISDLVAILEAGFQKGMAVPRTNPNTLKVERFNVFGPMLMAGIDKGKMPDTILDRSISIRMKRNIGKKLSYRPRLHSEEGRNLGAELAEWAKSVVDLAKDIEPIMPQELNDREQDKWEPLFIVGHLADTVADVTGVTDVAALTDGWEAKIRKASLELSKEDSNEEDTTDYGLTMLKDTRSIFYNEFECSDKIETSRMLEQLNAMEEAPWSSYLYLKPLSSIALAKILRPFGIKPKEIRFGPSNVLRGYYRADFEDAWERYLEIPPEIPATPATVATPATNSAVDFHRYSSISPELLEDMSDTALSALSTPIESSNLRDFQEILRN